MKVRILNRQEFQTHTLNHYVTLPLPKYRFGGKMYRFGEKYRYGEKKSIFFNKKGVIIVKFAAEVRRTVY